MRREWAGVRGVADDWEKQIPFGNDNKKGKNKSKGKGSGVADG